jgi:RNA polymerase sigma factor (sigma-70 family)
MSTLEFNQLLLSNAEFLKPFAITLTKDFDVADDLFQETMYRALSYRDKYRVGTNIKAWLFTIMRNIFINNYRRKAKRSTIFDKNGTDYILDTGKYTVINDADTNMNLKAIQTAIHNLPDIFKNPFVLYYNGYHYNEIAIQLEEPLGTIKSRIHFARKLLKETLLAED